MKFTAVCCKYFWENHMIACFKCINFLPTTFLNWIDLSFAREISSSCKKPQLSYILKVSYFLQVIRVQMCFMLTILTCEFIRCINDSVSFWNNYLLVWNYGGPWEFLISGLLVSVNSSDALMTQFLFGIITYWFGIMGALESSWFLDYSYFT